MAQSVERLTSAQAVISRFMSSSPASGSVPTARSLEPAWDSVSPSLSAPNPLMFCLSLSLSLSLSLKKKDEIWPRWAYVFLWQQADAKRYHPFN